MQKKGLLLLVAGINGAIGSTLALAVQILKHFPETILPYLMTAGQFPYLDKPWHVHMAGWDIQNMPLSTVLKQHGVVPDSVWQPYAHTFNDVIVKKAPNSGLSLEAQVDELRTDIMALAVRYPDTIPVFVNLLPATRCYDLTPYENFTDLYRTEELSGFADLSYVMAAILSGVPIVNFTPNHVEGPVIIEKATQQGLPMAGRDGKTGQTYLKVVLGSAFRARRLFVNGWYSLNILGNKDGQNLMNPQNADCKLKNKTDVLNDVLGYRPGQKENVNRQVENHHKVHIDYYPPRGDSKEAWDVIDFEGLFGLPMSLRINLQGRDSILAAPLVLDLARWMCALKLAGYKGPVSDLAFYFKKSIGDHMPHSFQDQLFKLQELEHSCEERVRKNNPAP